MSIDRITYLNNLKVLPVIKYITSDDYMSNTIIGNIMLIDSKIKKETNYFYELTAWIDDNDDVDYTLSGVDVYVFSDDIINILEHLIREYSSTTLSINVSSTMCTITWTEGEQQEYYLVINGFHTEDQDYAKLCKRQFDTAKYLYLLDRLGHEMDLCDLLKQVLCHYLNVSVDEYNLVDPRTLFDLTIRPTGNNEYHAYVSSDKRTLDTLCLHNGECSDITKQLYNKIKQLVTNVDIVTVQWFDHGVTIMKRDDNGVTTTVLLELNMDA